MTLKKLAAGSGYDYLTRQVAAQDAALPAGGLSSYYTERGEAPGIWVGSGLDGLGIRPGEMVTEEHMQHLFGIGEHPLADQLRAAALAAGLSQTEAEAAGRLGAPFRVRAGSGQANYRAELAASCRTWNVAAGRPERAKVPDEVRAKLRTELGREFFVREHGRAPSSEAELVGAIVRWSKPSTVTVAGFDASFSPPKSVSALWALADPQLAALVERAHQAAVGDALAYLERHALYTRLGADGVEQVDVRGLVAVRFTHRDSRAGDPDLHSHVAIANKVETLDGRWRAIDARPLYKAHAGASAAYDTALAAHLRELVGVRLVPRPGRGRTPVWDIDGVDPKLCETWSSRRSAIDETTAELAAKFRLDHGRPPTNVELVHLAQQANLATRQAKHAPRTLTEQRAAWRGQAEAVVGQGGVEAMIARVIGRPTPALFLPDADWLERTAARIVTELEAGRATWQEWHVRAEVLRQLRGLPIAPEQLTAITDQLVDTTLTHRSWRIDPVGDLASDPDVLRRLDGRSVYTVAGETRYTSGRMIAAERRLLATAALAGGRSIDPALVDLALLESVANGTTLNPGQAHLVREMATSGCRLQLAIAPAGTGKTTALAVLASAWTSGGGTVVGLAPSAVAADVLADNLGAPCDTLAKLAHAIVHPDTAPSWAATIGPGSLVIIDEAGMADTPTLDQVVAHVIDRGGSVRLVGDDHQLGAVAAGGVLTDIQAAHGALRLDEVLRFADPAEAAASLALRDGDPAAIGFYLDNQRIQPADAATITGQVLAAWQADRAAGLDAIMLAHTRDQVAQLNHHARTLRLGGRAAGPEVTLDDGNRASAGDLIVTRRNNRTLRTSTGNQWVRNGDRWQVTQVGSDGSLAARHLKTGRAVTLPADYVAASTELGYATTIHGAQGVTADTCHGLLTGDETRQQLYTMATRGRLANHLHVQSTGDGRPDPLDLDTLTDRSTSEILERVLAHDEHAVSATTAARQATDPALQLAPAVAAYSDALGVGAGHVLGTDAVRRLEEQADQLVLWLSSEPAWPTLRGHLLQFAAAGHDPVDVLRDAIDQGDLDTASDPAAVLDWRIDPTRHLPPGPLAWLPGVPTTIANDSTWGPYLHARADLVARLAKQVREQDQASPTAWQLGTSLPAQLEADLRVWRAAARTPVHDLRPTGEPAHTAAGRRWQHHLDQQLTGAGMPDIRPWWPQLEPLSRYLLDDSRLPMLAARLKEVSRHGGDAADVLDTALHDGPLPAEQPVAALIWRIDRHDPTQEGWPPVKPSPGPRSPRPEDLTHRPNHDRSIRR